MMNRVLCKVIGLNKIGVFKMGGGEVPLICSNEQHVPNFGSGLTSALLSHSWF